MADFGIDLKARLADYAPLTALIGTGKIHWGKVPQGTAKPYIELATISQPQDEHLKGYDGSQQARVQADCYSTMWGEARAMAGLIKSAVFAPATVGDTVFGHTKIEGPRDLGEDTAAGYVHRASLDLLVEYRMA